MATEATQTGAEELNRPAPTSVEHAAQTINGLFTREEVEPPPKKKEETPEAGGEDHEEESEDSTEDSTEDQEASEEDTEEEGEEQDAQPLTTLSELADRLGVDESSLYDLKLPTKIDGEEGQATLSQLVKSFQLEGHLNRENMKVAESRKELESQREKLEKERNEKLQELQQSLQVASQILYGDWSRVNWDQLKQEDPVEYLQKKEEFAEYQQALGQVNQSLQQEYQKYQEAQKEAMQNHVKEQQKKLLDAIPEWNNKDTLKKEYGQLVSFLQDDLGVTKEELDSLTDHRFYLLARDAMRYRNLKKADPRKTHRANKPTPTVKAGSNNSQQKQAVQMQGLHKNLRKKKDVKSAAALINEMYKNKKKVS